MDDFEITDWMNIAVNSTTENAREVAVECMAIIDNTLQEIMYKYSDPNGTLCRVSPEDFITIFSSNLLPFLLSACDINHYTIAEKLAFFKRKIDEIARIAIEINKSNLLMDSHTPTTN